MPAYRCAISYAPGVSCGHAWTTGQPQNPPGRCASAGQGGTTVGRGFGGIDTVPLLGVWGGTNERERRRLRKTA